MRTAATLAAFLSVVSGCGEGAGEFGPDAGPPDPGGTSDTCEPYASLACDESDNSVWLDSCGTFVEIADECLSDTYCDGDRGLCCESPIEDELFDGQPWTTMVDLTYGGSGTEATWSLGLDDIDYQTDARGQILFWRIPIDDGHARFGFATHIFDPDAGDYDAFGLYWIAEGVHDLADTETGTGTSATLEGLGATFRHPLPELDHQSIELRLAREEESGGDDWFALYAAIDGGDELLVGRALHPRGSAGVRATLAESSALVIQVGKVEPDPFALSDLPTFEVASSVPTLGGSPPTLASARYSTSSPRFLASDVHYDGDRLRFAHGGDAGRCTPPGPLY